MGLFFCWSAAIYGLEAVPVRVEVDIASGLPKFTIVGLPDTAVSESRERVRAAIQNSGFSFPRTRVTVNLAPAYLKKQGPAYDLAIALSILSANGTFSAKEILQNSIILGELALDGNIQPVTGALLAATMARAEGKKHLFLAPGNAEQANLVKGLDIHPCHTLAELVHRLQTGEAFPLYQKDASKKKKRQKYDLNLRHVRGQEHAKRAVEIAAAGGHNILLSGPPGSGKTLLARTLPSILPRLSFEEALEITKIHSVTETTYTSALVADRPFRAPHHSASSVALVGGGASPKPGEVSLAHRGVLFLDEFPEFPRAALENLRQPLEDGIVTISRAAGTIAFPAQFSLVAAMNPCPCGHLGDEHKACTCTPTQVQRYRKKISGPVLDRIDLYVEVPRVSTEKLTKAPQGETSSIVQARVQKARNRQQVRYKKLRILTNAELSSAHMEKIVCLSESASNLLTKATDAFHLSARSYTRLLKVARTIADLADVENIEETHIAEALQYRPQREA